MSKITTKARKLKVGDHVKFAGTKYKIVSLNLSFGRTPAPKQSFRSEDYVRISLPAKETLAVRRK